MQNAEQSSSSIWAQLHKPVSKKDKAKDYLRVVLADIALENNSASFNDAELDKFISDVNNQKTSLSDYTPAQLETFAEAIYALWKN